MRSERWEAAFKVIRKMLGFVLSKTKNHCRIFSRGVVQFGVEEE